MDRPTRAYIPPNISGGGSFLNGMLSIRNAIEAGILGGFFFILRLLLTSMIPIEIVSQVVGWILILLGIGSIVICLMGVGGEPFSIFVMNVLNFENRRIFVTLRPPMPEGKEEVKEVKEKKPSMLDKLFAKKSAKDEDSEEGGDDA